MKLTIERAALLRSLAHVQSVVEKRNTIPILSNVLLNAENGTLALTATDLDLAIVEQVPADVQQGGGTTAMAHTFYDIVRKLPDGAQVELETDAGDGRLMVRAGRSEFSLACLPREDFPVMAEGELPHSFVLPARDLRRLIEKTRFAISTEETRYYLNGIYLHGRAGAEGVAVMRAVATDGHRLARVEIPAPEGGGEIPGVILPRKTVQEVHKLIEDADAEVHIALSETKVRFAFGSIVLTSRLIDGTFPDYERVIPADNDRILTVDRRMFAEAVDRVSTISSEKSRAVKMKLGDSWMTLSASSPDAGSATEEVPISFDGPEMEIGFNARYLLDIAGEIDGDNANFRLADPGSPTVIEGAPDEGALYVLMPLRV